MVCFLDTLCLQSIFYYIKLLNNEKFQGFYFRIQITDFLIFCIIYNEVCWLLIRSGWNRSGLRLYQSWFGRHCCQRMTWKRCRFVTCWNECIISREDFKMFIYYAFYAESYRVSCTNSLSQLLAVVVLICANKRPNEGFFLLIFLI